MVHYISQSQVEQEIRLRGEIANVEQYWNFRMGTSAVGVAAAAVE
jgi:hypothetical protein